MDVKELKMNIPVSPLSVYSHLRKKIRGEKFLLESVEGPRKTARFSCMGFHPVFRFVSKEEKVMTEEGSFETEDPFSALRDAFYRWKGLWEKERKKKSSSHLKADVPFQGGMVGYFSYDIVRFFESLPTIAEDDLDLPDAHFIVPGVLVCFDHLSQRVYAFVSSMGGSKGREGSFHTLIKEAFFSAQKEMRKESMNKKPDRSQDIKFGIAKENMSQKDYESAVLRAKEYILAGDIFQVVLSRRKSFDYTGDELGIYRRLRSINPSPYMFMLEFDETSVIGTSPEMLVRLEKGVLTTRPIAGTRPRSADPEEDEKLKVEMLLDEKERAEHIMLVDLHRNDMGRVSEYGSVKVNVLMGQEKFSHVQHMVSNVTSRIREGMDGFDALKACFPAGTLSGAPKCRAMEIIEELEPTRRGPYGGVVGYMGFDGDMDFAITIRTIFTKEGRAHVQAGAGIVSDSVPQREYDETEFKMGAMLKSLSPERRDEREAGGRGE